MDTVERRRSERYPAMLAARIYDTASGKDECSLARTLGAGGCELLSSNPHGPGKTIMCELVVGLSTVRVIGKVVSEYAQAQGVFVSCVEFIMLDEDVADCLQAFIGKIRLAGNQ